MIQYDLSEDITLKNTVEKVGSGASGKGDRERHTHRQTLVEETFCSARGKAYRTLSGGDILKGSMVRQVFQIISDMPKTTGRKTLSANRYSPIHDRAVVRSGVQVPPPFSDMQDHFLSWVSLASLCLGYMH